MPQPPTADFRLLHERFTVVVGDREVVLTPTQFRLLAVLVSEPGRTFSRAELVQHAFGAPVDERTAATASRRGKNGHAARRPGPFRFSRRGRRADE